MLLPVYLVTVMGASMVTLGVIEGIAEATASIVKLFFGALSDWLGKRKLLAGLGYALAPSQSRYLRSPLPWTGWCRPASSTASAKAYAARRAMRLILISLMWLTANQFRPIFRIAVIPALLSVGVLALFVRASKRPAALRKAEFPLSLVELRRLGSSNWLVVAVASVFTLARSGVRPGLLILATAPS